MAKKAYPLSKVYGLLEPGPVIMVTTANKARTNIMTMSWHTILEFEPPLVGCVISNRNTTFDILKATKECVINIPTVALAKKVVGVGNTSDAKVDKFKKFGLTPAAASYVKAPLIDECYANLECKVVDGKMAGGQIQLLYPRSASKRGSTPQAKTRAPFTIAGMALLCWPARRSSCLPK